MLPESPYNVKTRTDMKNKQWGKIQRIMNLLLFVHITSDISIWVWARMVQQTILFVHLF